jgi:hypothetical protein
VSLCVFRAPLTREFYFIGDLRGQNKADIDALLENMKFF